MDSRETSTFPASHGRSREILSRFMGVVIFHGVVMLPGEYKNRRRNNRESVGGLIWEKMNILTGRECNNKNGDILGKKNDATNLRTSFPETIYTIPNGQMPSDWYKCIF